MGTLSPEQELAVEALTRGIVNKIMHTPITTLKSAARESSEATTVIDLVRRLFGLRERKPIWRSGRKTSRCRREDGGAELMARLRIGSRGSQLALWQANHISALLREQGHEVEIEIIKTTGDKITDVALAQVGTKGMFTKEIEDALAEGRVDLAVHSLKDLPTELPPGFELVAITTRVNPRDVFLSVKYDSIEALPQERACGNQQPAAAGAVEGCAAGPGDSSAARQRRHPHAQAGRRRVRRHHSGRCRPDPAGQDASG